MATRMGRRSSSFQRRALWCLGLGLLGVATVSLTAPALTLNHPDAPGAAVPPNGEPSATPTADTPKPARYSQVVFVGDSYTSGAGATDPTKRWTDLVAGEYGWTQHNLSKGGTGYVTAGPLAGGNTYADRLTEIVAAKPDLVLLTGGRNDLATPTAAVATAARNLVAGIQAQLPVARIVILNPLWDDDDVPDAFTALTVGLQQIATEAGVTYVDLGQPLADHPELLSDDSVHPNDAGYTAIAAATTAALTAAGLQP